MATAEEYLLGVLLGTLSAMPVAGEHHPAFEEYCDTRFAPDLGALPRVTNFPAPPVAQGEGPK